MDTKVNTLRQFFRQPNRGYLIREIARLAGVNHVTARKHIREYLKEGMIVKKAAAPYPVFSANTSSKKYLNLKLCHNLELIRESGLVERLEREYDYPVIVLFGSFAKAIDDEASDVDICIISNVDKAMDLSSYERVLGRKISIHKFTRKTWETAKRKNPGLVNGIANGIVLSGQLEVV